MAREKKYLAKARKGYLTYTFVYDSMGKFDRKRCSVRNDRIKLRVRTFRGKFWFSQSYTASAELPGCHYCVGRLTKTSRYRWACPHECINHNVNPESQWGPRPVITPKASWSFLLCRFRVVPWRARWFIQTPRHGWKHESITSGSCPGHSRPILSAVGQVRDSIFYSMPCWSRA